MVQRTRLRIDRVDHVVLDEEPADAAVAVARLEVFAVLVENLEAVVAAVGHPETALRVEHHRVRRAELTVKHTDLAPRLHELAVGREFADARGGAPLEPFSNRGRGRHALRIVAVGDVDAAVGAGHHVVGLVELAVGVARLAGHAQAQQLLALGAEFVDLLALGAFLVVGEVGHPHVAVLVQVDAVRCHHHALADVGEHLAGVTIELEHRIDRVVVAIHRPATGRAGGTALVGPHVAVLWVDVDAGRRSPRPPSGELAPVLGDLRRGIGQAFARDEVGD